MRSGPKKKKKTKGAPMSDDETEPTQPEPAEPPPVPPIPYDDPPPAAVTPDVVAFCKETLEQLAALRRYVQEVRGEQIGIAGDVQALRDVLNKHADQLDALAVAVDPLGEPPAPAPSLFVAGAPGHRGRSTRRTFEQTEPPPPAEPPAPAIPPYRPGAGVIPAPAPAPPVPTRPGAAVVTQPDGSIHVDPQQPGEHDVEIPGIGPVTIRVHGAAERVGFIRRQGGGRTFRPR